MKLRGAWRKESGVRQVVSSSTFLAMSLFVAFGLLDLDSAQTQRLWLTGEVTAARSAADRECVPVEDPSRLSPSILAFPSLILRAIDSFSKSPGRFRSPATTARFARVRRHLPMRTAITAAPPASEDPA